AGGPAAAVRRRARGGPSGQGLPGRGAAPRRPPAGRLGPRPHPPLPRLVVRPVRPYGAAPQKCNESVQCAVGLSDFPCAAMNASTLPDVEIARFNMVEQQIRPWNVLDSKVLDALSAVRREQFVPPALRALAFSDLELPLQINAVDTRQVMLAPKVEARLAQELQLTPTDCVLEIGTGSGYQAALLAHLAQQVTSVEIDNRLVAFAQQHLQMNNVTNVKVETGDGRNGWGTTEYDAILVTGSVPVVPGALKYQLRVGGRLVVIVGQAPIMTACRITRTTAASFETVNPFETVVKPLRGVTVSQFKFCYPGACAPGRLRFH